jgi:diguanylate cyclase
MFAFQDRRSRPAALVALGIIAVITLLNIRPVFDAVGGLTVLRIYDLSIIVIAGFSAVLSLLLARSYRPGEVLRRIWLFLGIGLLLWTVGEAIWAYFELILQVDPYPSPADYVWLVGYIPLFAALYLRFHSLGTTPERSRLMTLIVVFGVLVALVSYLVLLPMMQEPESEPFAQFIGVMYPLGDLAVALGAMLIFLVLTGGALSRPWMMIAAGFIIVSVADLFYTYADWQGLLLSGGETNLISSVANVLYYVSYVVIAFGVYLQARLQKIL